jgi:hypothetical protein
MGLVWIATSLATSFNTSHGSCHYIFYVQYVVTIVSYHYIYDKRTIVIVSMTMSSSGHKSYLVTHLL